MKNFSLILSTVALIMAAVAIINSNKHSASMVATSADGATSSADATVSEDFSNSVAKALKADPKMIIEAMQKYQDDLRAAEEKAAQEALAKYIDEINSDANAPSVGPKDAKVVVVEFFDFSCGYCKRLAPELAKVVADNADVKFIFKPLSFLAPISGYQAKAALAANKQGKFVEFYKAVMTSSSRLDEAQTDELAKSLGIDVDQYKKDMNSAETQTNLAKISELAENIQVRGVPTVLINGKHVQAINAEDLQNAINAEK